MADSIPLFELQQMLLEEVHESLYPPGRRVQISLAYLQIVHDHHYAIATLLDKEIYVSAFALARSLYEALVKGLWASHCATDLYLEKIAAGKELESLNKLTDHLLGSELPPLISSSLRTVKLKYWKVLSSLTHAGHSQVKRRVATDGVGPTYQDAEIKELKNFISFMTLVATLEMANLSNNEAAIQSLAELLPTPAES